MLVTLELVSAVIEQGDVLNFCERESWSEIAEVKPKTGRLPLRANLLCLNGAEFLKNPNFVPLTQLF